NIFTQLWNNKRSNGWMALELLLAFCFIWYLVDFFFALGYNYTLKNHRDLVHTWKINLSTYPSDHYLYDAERSTSEKMFEDYSRILDVIKTTPSVETLGISYYNSSPGSNSYSSNSFLDIADSSRMASGQIIHICPQYDFLRVFRHTREDGKIPVSTQDYDWSVPNSILINRLMEESLCPEGGKATGKLLGYKYGKGEHRVVGVVDNTKRFDSGRPQGVVYMAQRLSEENFMDAEISIRVSNVSESQFNAGFIDQVSDRLQIGNYYFLNMLPYTKIHADTERSFGLTTIVSAALFMLSFFLVSIILCLIGTFWYRVSRRKEEIGIRIAVGAPHSGIRKLFILEAVCLLLLVVPFAMILEYQIVNLDLLLTYGEGHELNSYLIYQPLTRFLVTNLITFCLVAFIVSLAVWIPAQKAAEMEPADALHDE
ncbi:MAG: hypothetical protein LUG98_07660, partial [Tannerellaceae bacterium]|nr:hypothetical protein [Tannerellaceae bacterium]